MSTDHQTLADALNAFADTLNQIAAIYAALLADLPTMQTLREQAEVAMRHAPRVDPGSPIYELNRHAKLAAHVAQCGPADQVGAARVVSGQALPMTVTIADGPSRYRDVEPSAAKRRWCASSLSRFSRRASSPSSAV